MATHPLCRAAGLSADDGRRPCRPPRAGPCRQDAGRRAAGPRALLRARPGRRDEAGDPRLAELGCETLLLTNAAGSLRLDMPPGAVMLVADHINFSGVNPLFGETGNSRFVDMTDAYDPALARPRWSPPGEDVFEGVYIWFSGPSFETPAEIRAARMLGADAVGMSTVPETILARHVGLRVAALSLMTNYAAGLTREQARPRADHGGGAARRRARCGGCCGASSKATLEPHAAAGDHPQEARRTGAVGRGDRLHRPRHHRQQPERGPGRGLRHGGVLPRHDHARAGGADPGPCAIRRHARLERPRPARPGHRQAFDRRRRRQGQPDAGADRGGLRRLRADDLRPRPRPYRRHARQAVVDLGLRRAARHGDLPPGRARGRLRHHRPDRRSRARPTGGSTACATSPRPSNRSR